MLGDVLWPPCIGYRAAKKKEDNTDDLGNPREAMPPLKGHRETAESCPPASTASAHIKAAGISGCPGRSLKPPASNQPAPPWKALFPPEAAEVQSTDTTEATAGAQDRWKRKTDAIAAKMLPQKELL